MKLLIGKKIKYIFLELREILLKIEGKLIRLISKINIGKRLILFIFLLILSVVFISFYQYASTYTTNVIEREKSMLTQNMSTLLSLLEGKKEEYQNYANILSEMPSESDMKGSNANTNLLYKFKSKLNINGIDLELRSNQFEVIETIESSFQPDGKNLKDTLQTFSSQGIPLTFFKDSDSYIQLVSISPVMDENGFNAIGTIIVSRILYVEFLNYLQTNLGVPIQLYNGEELFYSSNESHENLISNEIVNSFNEENNKQYEIKERLINDHKFLIGYVPIRDFFGQSIGYFTIISSLDESQAAINNMFRRIIVISIIILCISLLITIVITRSITLPLRKIIGTTQLISKGNLSQTVEIKTGDELAIYAGHFNKMIYQLREMIGDLLKSSKNIVDLATDLSAGSEEASASSEEVAASSQEIASGAETQALEIENAYEIVTDIKKKAKNVNINTVDVFNSIENAFAKSSTGLNVMSEVGNDMKSILTEVNLTGEEIFLLKKQINKIDDIIEAITYINEETTLLSFNAAIEAARAGQAGRGFAVVADEIRKLANQSNSSLEEVNEIFNQINTAMDTVIKSVKVSQELVRDGDKSVVFGGEVLNDVKMSIDMAKKFAKEINNDAKEQADGAVKIEESISNIKEVSKQNSQGANQAARANNEQAEIIAQVSSTSEQLLELANNLNLISQKFNL